jgi:hypothetical protein
MEIFYDKKKRYGNFFNIAGTNKGDMVKKAKESPLTETVNERANNENPWFQLKLSPCYAHGTFMVRIIECLSLNPKVDTTCYFDTVFIIQILHKYYLYIVFAFFIRKKMKNYTKALV